MMTNFRTLKKSIFQKDILAEQGMLCASLGIVECIRMDVLKKALKWVTRNGCVADTTKYKHVILKRAVSLIGRPS